MTYSVVVVVIDVVVVDVVGMKWRRDVGNVS